MVQAYTIRARKYRKGKKTLTIYHSSRLKVNSIKRKKFYERQGFRVSRIYRVSLAMREDAK